MKKLKLKIITGFRLDQQFTIDVAEAHKAYFLFNHPEERGTFENGVAIRGEDIKQIDPDYHATMGWLPTHQLDSNDWEEIRGQQVDRMLRDVCSKAQKIAKLPDPMIHLQLWDAAKFLPKEENKRLGTGMKKIAEISDGDEERREILKEQRLKCEICGHTGWKETMRGESVVRVQCDCQTLK